VVRAGAPHALQFDDAEITALVRRELRPLLGVTAEPADSLVTRWGGGLPQYAVGHVERVARIRAAVAGVPGLGVCGAAFDGVGIPACIASARAAVDRVSASVRDRGQ
jgi:oxygen-dependent protoporphyrinogen oxidase